MAAASRSKLLAQLGLSRGATPEAIKQAYRDLARQTHPDVNPGCAASGERFQQITAAYEGLTADGGVDDTTELQELSPAMQARYNAARRNKPSEYPAWFKPDESS